MSSLCWECKYEHSDCKGDKWVEKSNCPYFSKKLAINYPKKIEELERKVEFFESLYQGQLDANERLLLRADRLEAERNELKKRMEKMKYDFDFINSDRNLLKADNEKLKEENVDLRFESVRAFERGTKFPCNLDCDGCGEKCRAWIRGYKTCEGNWDIAHDKLIAIQQICNEYLYKPVGKELHISDLKEPIISEEF